MADPAHRLRRHPKPRFLFVMLPRDLLYCLAWALVASLVGRLDDWLGWGFLGPVGFAATGMAYVYAVLALYQWRRRGRK